MIFPTLAVQLARNYPEFRSVFVPLVRSDPAIAHGSLYTQMRKLIAKPLQESAISTVIVIDGLDECKDEETTSAILSVLGRLVSGVPRKVKFILTSRPEPHIQAGFHLPLLKKFTEAFVLHDVELGLVTDDIRRFIDHGFLEMADSRGGLDNWPTDEEIEELCEQAAGSFAHAAAALQSYDLTGDARERGPPVQTIGNPQVAGMELQTFVDGQEPQIPAWKRLITRPLSASERVSLIMAIFSDSNEVDMVNHLQGDDAQIFVDLTDEVFSRFFASEEQAQ